MLATFVCLFSICSYLAVTATAKMFEQARERRVESVDILKVLLSREVLQALRDPAKARAARRAHLKFIQAEASAAQGNYKQFHAQASEANQDLEDTFGKGAYICCFFSMMQADFEISFHRYRIAADLIEKAVAGLSKDGGGDNDSVIFSCRSRLATCYEKLHLLDKAIDCYRQNLKLAPALDKSEHSSTRVNYFDTVACLADVYSARHLKDKAKEALGEATAICDRVDASAEIKAGRYVRLAHIADDLGDYAAAIAVLDKGQRSDPRAIEVYRGRGVVFCHEKQYEKAVIDFTAGLAIDPGDGNLYDWRSWAFEKQDGHHEEALKDLASAIQYTRTNNEKNWLYSRRAFLQAKYGNYKGAISDASEALKLKKQDTSSLLIRAESYEKLKQYENAIADFNILAANTKFLGHSDWADGNEKADRHPMGTRVFSGRAVAFLALGRKQEASADLAMAKKMQEAFAAGAYKDDVDDDE